jgi:hypothetical protein
MKVSELTGAQLDYWVAKAEGLNAVIERKFPQRFAFNVGTAPECCWVHGWKIAGEQLFAPSEDWAQGGPIIERKKIDIIFGENAWYVPQWCHGDVDGLIASGPTPLIAAMRAYVFSKFGDDVEDLSARQPGDEMNNKLLLLGGPGNGRVLSYADWPKTVAYSNGTMNYFEYVRTIITRYGDGGIDAAWYVYSHGDLEASDTEIVDLLESHGISPVCKATELHKLES